MGAMARRRLAVQNAAYSQSATKQEDREIEGDGKLTPLLPLVRLGDNAESVTLMGAAGAA